LHQDVGDIAVGLDARRERDHRCHGQGIEDLPEGEGARAAHAFSATRSPKMPCGRRARKRMSTRKAKPSLNGTEIYAAPKVSMIPIAKPPRIAPATSPKPP